MRVEDGPGKPVEPSLQCRSARTVCRPRTIRPYSGTVACNCPWYWMPFKIPVLNRPSRSSAMHAVSRFKSSAGTATETRSYDHRYQAPQQSSLLKNKGLERLLRSCRFSYSTATLIVSDFEKITYDAFHAYYLDPPPFQPRCTHSRRPQATTRTRRLTHLSSRGRPTMR